MDNETFRTGDKLHLSYDPLTVDEGSEELDVIVTEVDGDSFDCFDVYATHLEGEEFTVWPGSADVIVTRR